MVSIKFYSIPLSANISPKCSPGSLISTDSGLSLASFFVSVASCSVIIAVSDVSLFSFVSLTSAAVL